MRAFELYDNVFLKDNPALYGTIERTNTDSYEPLDDDLIIGHTEVPVDVLNDFVQAGVPPPGYVYVEFEDESAGNSLVSEDDIGLLSRTFQIGDNVKRANSPMTGAVVNLSESYLLAPILSCPDYFASPCPNPQNLQKCGIECRPCIPPQISHPNPHALICDVPSREVRRAQDLVKDDYLITEDWVGQVEDVQYDIVICLENLSIVVVRNLDGLYLPVKDNGKPLIALPLPESDVWRPDGVVALQGWSHTVPLIYPRIGQFVVADRTVLRRGRWVRGSYDTKVPSQGTILEIRAGEAAVHWEQRSFPTNVRSRRVQPSPPYELELYQNSKEFKTSADLRPRTDMIIYDSGKMPSKYQDQFHLGDHSQGPQRQKYSEAIDSRDICSGQDIGVGDHVKFRDPTAAAVKYQGIDGTLHGKLLKFDPELFYGWELNEFKVLHIKQSTTVLWQDGSVSTVDSSLLQNYALFEPELAPTDVVLKREGMRQRPVGPRGHGQSGIKDFDEMAFFESPHDLLPRSVGIIQTVDIIERVATVRWFKEPNIELRSNGQTMSPHSRYGPIGDDIEDVSLYEIMSFPTLQRKRRDRCIIVPPESSIEINLGKEGSNDASAMDPAASTGTSSKPVQARRQRTFPRGSGDPGADLATKTQHPVDWFGEIIALGLDGSNTVRLGGLQPCRDIQISSDSILALLDNGDFPDDPSDDGMDLDSILGSEWSDDIDLDAILETVEYEGGHRLDNDSGSENWESEDDEDDDVEFADAQEELSDSGDVDMDASNGVTTGTNITVKPAGIIHLKELLATEAPPQFAVLEEDPPSDQFGLHSIPTAGTFLKRIAKEHRALATSLPDGEIYVRTYESRLDLLRCLIVGPRDTPYENAPFLIDLYLPERFPMEPPTAHFHSWTSGLGRINPNLYEEGKICLSLLGTWSSRHECERWSENATILQLLVSLQGLVFVKKPFYNEAGFEGYENDKAYTRESELYSEKAFLMARGFVKYALTQPPRGMEDVLSWVYLSSQNANSTSLLKSIIARGRTVAQRSEEARQQRDERLMDAIGETEDETRVFLRPLSRGATVMLNRTMNELEGQLQQLDAKSNDQR
jgi:ubiquitin-conjugating enzyme E2 O